MLTGYFWRAIDCPLALTSWRPRLRNAVPLEKQPSVQEAQPVGIVGPSEGAAEPRAQGQSPRSTWPLQCSLCLPSCEMPPRYLVVIWGRCCRKLNPASISRGHEPPKCGEKFNVNLLILQTWWALEAVGYMYNSVTNAELTVLSLPLHHPDI